MEQALKTEFDGICLCLPVAVSRHDSHHTLDHPKSAESDQEPGHQQADHNQQAKNGPQREVVDKGSRCRRRRSWGGLCVKDVYHTTFHIILGGLLETCGQLTWVARLLVQLQMMELLYFQANI